MGAISGAAVALLLTPKTGDETREILREKGTDWARQARERASDWARRAQETMGDAQIRAQQYLGRGREVVEDTSAQPKAAFEAGRGAMRCNAPVTVFSPAWILGPHALREPMPVRQRPTGQGARVVAGAGVMRPPFRDTVTRGSRCRPTAAHRP